MRYCYAALLLAVLGAEACMLPPRQGQQQQTQLPATPSEVEATVRKHELEMERLEGNPVGLQIENTETELIKALKLTLGKESFSPGQPAPRSATTLVKALRETDIKLKLQPVLDDQGQPLGDDLVELTDSYTVRAQQLSRKITEQTATKDEIDEVRAGAKHSAKLGELKLSIMRVSMATTMSNSLVQTSSMGAMLRVANLVGSRKYMRMEFNGEDYGRVKKWLELQRRIETAAAISMGMLAAYQGVINGNGNPEALDLLAERALRSFPIEPNVSDAEARDYVKNLKSNVAKVKSQYESMLRKAHGDARYEAHFKAGVDFMFQGAESADKSLAERIEEDLAKCARGELDSAGSMIPEVRCKQVREAALRGETVPGATGYASNPDSSSGADIFSLLPGFQVIKASVEGVRALANGDAKGALSAAIGLVPGGGSLQTTFKQVSSMM